MGYPPQAIQSILRLSAQKRFEHAVKDIADAECLYVMADEEGDWSFWGDDDGHTSLAIWSDLEFARLSWHRQETQVFASSNWSLKNF